jgi:hypothetical protein
MLEKPHCIIIGAMKSGTTSLFSEIQKYEEIDVSKVKDTKFFVANKNNGNWNNGTKWYTEQFSNHGIINVEASTLYSKYPDYPEVPDRIFKTLKTVKLIYLVRNPIDRAISHYFHNRIVDKEIIDINTAFTNKHSKYYNYSDYGLQIGAYLNFIDKSNILIENFIDTENKKGEIENVINFILQKKCKKIKFQNFVVKNTFYHLIENNENSNDEQLKKLTKKKYNNKVQMALAFGLRKDVLMEMISCLQDKYDTFTQLMGIQSHNWKKKYEEHI